MSTLRLLQRGDTFLGNDLQCPIGQEDRDRFSSFGAGNVRGARDHDTPAIFQPESAGTEGLTFGPALQVIAHCIHGVRIRAARRLFQRIPGPPSVTEQAPSHAAPSGAGLSF